jgi:endoglucanase
VLLTVVVLCMVKPVNCSGDTWPLWEAYAEQFIQADGRVIDPADGGRTTSEGQAYAMFFALVANDRARFASLLQWTRHNLVNGEADNRLPAWLWGRRKDGTWGIVDSNSAADADTWLAYTLVEAGRLWEQPHYRRMGVELVRQIERYEVATLPGLGPMLLPGSRGFEAMASLWRLNPSYLMLQHFHRFAAILPNGPWQEIATNSALALLLGSPRGIAPDWVGYHESKRFVPDPGTGPIGSYDAIRVYLWAGMLAESDPLRSLIQSALSGIQRAITEQGGLPEKLDTVTGEPSGNAPRGFYYAVLPYLEALGDKRRASLLKKRMLRNHHAASGYYDRNLLLFSEGWREKRFTFSQQGELQLQQQGK